MRLRARKIAADDEEWMDAPLFNSLKKSLGGFEPETAAQIAERLAFPYNPNVETAELTNLLSSDMESLRSIIVSLSTLPLSDETQRELTSNARIILERWFDAFELLGRFHIEKKRGQQKEPRKRKNSEKKS